MPRWSSITPRARLPVERPPLRPIREEPLTGSRALRERMTSWRGLSGRTYVCSVHSIIQGDVPEAPGAVILGVRRDYWRNGFIVGAGHRGTVAEAIALCRPDGASEIHLHLLEENATARDAIIADLVGDNAI